MSVPPLLSTLGDAFAALCVVALPLWILGVPGDPGEPGHESAYARGWKMGLSVICVYPIVRLVDVAAVWGVRWLASGAMQTRLENGIAIFGALAFLLALLRLAWAIRVLSRS